MKKVTKLIGLLSLIILSFAQLRAEDTYEEMIREDRVWEYYKWSPNYWLADLVMCYYPVEEYEGVEFDEDFLGLYSYKFKGTEEHNGRIYHKCILDQVIIWTEKSHDSSCKCIIDTVFPDHCVGLVREDAGKVYLRPDSTTVAEYLYPYNRITERTLEAGEDLLLFDFTLKEGDIFMPYFTDRYRKIGMLTECEVASVSEQYGHKKFGIRKLNASNPNWMPGEYATGIGNIGEGYMLEYGWMQQLPYGSPQKIITQDQMINLFLNDQGWWSWFNNYYDLEGNVLYPGFNARPPAESGIGQVTDTEIDNGASAVYDMMGRRVTRTLPGSVYITNGRKFIAR